MDNYFDKDRDKRVAEAMERALADMKAEDKKQTTTKTSTEKEKEKTK